jgi:hypothetical protein
MEEVDKNKLKELIQILTQLSEDKKNLPKLLQFENENTSILYYTELLCTELDPTFFFLILKRIKEINFFNHDEFFVKRIIHSISSFYEVEFMYLVLHEYFSKCTKNSELLLLLFQSIRKSITDFQFFENVLDLAELMTFDIIIFKIYKELLEMVSMGTSYLNIHLSWRIVLNLKRAGEDLVPFYSCLRLLLLRSNPSASYFELLNVMSPYIPKEDSLKLSQKFKGIFSLDLFKRDSFYEYFLALFDKPNPHLEILKFSSMY